MLYVIRSPITAKASGRVIAHHTSAARMAKVKLDVTGENEAFPLEPFC
jgi:hypothetical protein